MTEANAQKRHALDSALADHYADDGQSDFEAILKAYGLTLLRSEDVAQAAVKAEQTEAVYWENVDLLSRHNAALRMALLLTKRVLRPFADLAEGIPQNRPPCSPIAYINQDGRTPGTLRTLTVADVQEAFRIHRAETKLEPEAPIYLVRWMNGNPPRDPENKAWLVHNFNWTRPRIVTHSAGTWWCNGEYCQHPFDLHAELITPTSGASDG